MSEFSMSFGPSLHMISTHGPFIMCRATWILKGFEALPIAQFPAEGGPAALRLKQKTASACLCLSFLKG